MDQDRERIHADLCGIVSGDVLFDDVDLQQYATDASIYEIQPLGIVRPRNTTDVSNCVRYAAENQIPIHARGSGTGLAGGCLGTGIVLDFSAHMRRVLEIGDDGVRIQPGLVHAQLNRLLQAHGRHFGPDPAKSRVSTMGSVIAVDSGGSHWPRYGSPRRHVKELEVVLADGEVVRFSTDPISGPDFAAQVAGPKGRIVSDVVEIVRRNEQIINNHRPKSAVNRCGYHLWDVLTESHLDSARILTGSEGTLALITEATLSTQPLPVHRSVVLLMFEHLQGALNAAEKVMAMGPSACDLMDRRHVSLAKEANPRFDVLIPDTAEWLLLVEQSGESPQEVRRWVTRLVDWARRRAKMVSCRYTMDREEAGFFWELARGWVPTLQRLKGSTRPVPFVEDMAVPMESLKDMLFHVQSVLKRYQLIAGLYAHVGQGQLHVRPFIDLRNGDDIRKLEPLAADLYARVWELGGTISGEHAAGWSKTPFLQRQFGPLYKVFREIKQVFDPHNILNPGKVISHESTLATRNLRAVPADISHSPLEELANPSPKNGKLVELQLYWRPNELASSTESCNGCGICRTTGNEARMCPVFRFAPREEASPRAKANLMRSILSRRIDASAISGPELKAVADLCVNCHQCRIECPVGVDVPKQMIEAKAGFVATNGLKLKDHAVARIDLLSFIGSAFSSVGNWAIQNRQARFLIEKSLGIARSRKLPRFAARSFLRTAARLRLTRPTRRSGRKVVYFVDIFANYHDTALAQSLVEILEHNGVAVYVHPAQTHSAMAMISHGLIDKARVAAARNVAILAEAVRQGYHIVATEPAAALCLKHEYLNLLDDEDAQLVADNTSEACSYLWQLHQTGSLQLDFKPVHATVGYHLPCHLKALQVGSPGENLLRLIPGLQVIRTERGCSGMAGTYGLKRANYRNSLRAGWGLISALRNPNIQLGATECSSCKIQMEQGTTKPTIHTLKFLAIAYGLRPELRSLLTARSYELVVT